MGEPPREFGARALLDFIGEPGDHLAENADLLFAELAVDKDLGRMPQRLGAVLARAPANRIVEILQRVRDFRHEISRVQAQWNFQNQPIAGNF